MIRKLLYQPFFIKLFHWEYWPFHAVYGPIYFYWFWLCIKARSFFFFNTSNPSIDNGGFLMESKKQIYDLLPQKYYPQTIFFNTESSVDEILKEIQSANAQFPLIGKPDIGMKGLSVRKFHNEQELLEYAANSKVNFLVQEFIPYENEVGIFYYRFPNKLKGHISGIVEKEFLAIEGDGESTMTELLRKDKRYILQIPVLKKMYGYELKRILRRGEKRILVPYGNHVRGAKFIDVSHLIDEKLTNTIDKICQQVTGFYYGRLDIRFNSWEELKRGENISVIEVNGAGSEPTHIYDPKHSIFYAWREIVRHWNILWKISQMNHRWYQLPYMKISSGIEMFRQNKEYVKMISEDLKQTA